MQKLRLFQKKILEILSGNNYKKYLVTLDSFSSGTNYKGIEQIHLREFLKQTEF